MEGRFKSRCLKGGMTEGLKAGRVCLRLEGVGGG